MIKITSSANLLAVLAATTLLGCSGSSREREVNTNNQSATDAGTGSGFTEGLTQYGQGDYAIYLSAPDPRRYCWYIEETVRICGGNGSPTRDDLYVNVCYDDETNCAARKPVDSEVDNGTCWTRIDYDTVSNGALYGDCSRVDRYFGDNPDTQCLFHKHCPQGRRCMDYQCVCPPGADCGCFECPPVRGPRCEGNVLLVDRIGEGCDDNDRCWIDTQRTDCNQTGGTCNEARGICEGGSGGEPDAGVVDAGGGSTPDAGCMCPPTAPPRCDGDTVVELHCDASTCVVEEVRTDCTSSGLVCDPETAQCVEDVECRTAADCPPVPALPPGQCGEVRCENNACVQETNPC